MTYEKLPYSLKKYFKITKKSQKISISKLKTIRARPKGIENAHKHMYMAYRDYNTHITSKRNPIALEKNTNGTYTVLDGNSTVYWARRNNWKYIIAEIVQKERRIAGQWCGRLPIIFKTKEKAVSHVKNNKIKNVMDVEEVGGNYFIWYLKPTTLKAFGKTYSVH
jgi:hypothetical protein